MSVGRATVKKLETRIAELERQVRELTMRPPIVINNPMPAVHVYPQAPQPLPTLPYPYPDTSPGLPSPWFTPMCAETICDGASPNLLARLPQN